LKQWLIVFVQCFPLCLYHATESKELWKEDALLLAADVKDGRCSNGFAVERFGTIPSLPQLKSMFRSLKARTDYTSGVRCV
jgi:hypothetical protein